MVGHSDMNPKNILIISLFIILLRPHIEFVHPLIKVYLGDVLLFGVLIFSMILMNLTLNRKYLNLLLYALIILISLSLISVLNIYINEFQIDLVLNLFKVLYYFTILWFFNIIMERLERPIQTVNKIINISFNIIVIVSIFQLLNPPIFGELVKVLYGSEKLRDIWSGYPRIYSTFMNANWFGVAVIFFASYFISLHRLKIISTKRMIIKTLLIIFLLIISASRTALIGFLILILKQTIKRNTIKNILIYFTGITLLISSYLFLPNKIPLLDRALKRTTDIFKQLLSDNPNLESIVGERYEYWRLSFEMFLESPFIGYGGVSHIPHNSYLLFLLDYGLIGAFICIIVIIFTYFELKSRMKFNGVSKSVEIEWLKNFTLPFAIMSLAADFFFTTQVMLLFIFVLSLAIRKIYSIDNVTRENSN